MEIRNFFIGPILRRPSRAASLLVLLLRFLFLLGSLRRDLVNRPGGTAQNGIPFLDDRENAHVRGIVSEQVVWINFNSDLEATLPGPEGTARPDRRQDGAPLALQENLPPVPAAND